MKNFILAITLFALFSCGSKSTPESSAELAETDSTAATETLPSEVTPLSAFQILDENNKAGIHMTDSGDVFIVNEQIGTLDENGVMTSIAGQVLARIDENEMLLDAQGNPVVKIDVDGTLDDGSGLIISWSPDGKWMKGAESTGFKISPGNSPSKRAASLILFLHTSIGEVTTSSSN
jgi:hypothetical protein